jgi:hypothetical protein
MKSSNYVRKFSIYEKKNKAYFGKMQKWDFQKKIHKNQRTSGILSNSESILQDPVKQIASSISLFRLSTVPNSLHINPVP